MGKAKLKQPGTAQVGEREYGTEIHLSVNKIDYVHGTICNDE
jgi:hypothetical protein